MAGTKQSGFTIIELMLFLGVTGALFAALLLGVNTNIAQQQYKESVVSYSSLLQRQYSIVSNPRIERDDTWKCTNGRVEQDLNAGQPRGTSACVILGRAVQIKNGETIELNDVVGTEPAALQLTDDIQTLVAYRPTISPMNADKAQTDWGSVLKTTEGIASTASFLILRSPSSGLVRVFASSEPLPSDLASIITPEAGSVTIRNCVIGQSVSIPTQSVVLDARVAGSAGVRVDEDESSC